MIGKMTSTRGNDNTIKNSAGLGGNPSTIKHKRVNEYALNRPKRNLNVHSK